MDKGVGAETAAGTQRWTAAIVRAEKASASQSWAQRLSKSFSSLTIHLAPNAERAKTSQKRTEQLAAESVPKVRSPRRYHSLPLQDWANDSDNESLGNVHQDRERGNLVTHSPKGAAEQLPPGLLSQKPKIDSPRFGKENNPLTRPAVAAHLEVTNRRHSLSKSTVADHGENAENVLNKLPQHRSGALRSKSNPILNNNNNSSNSFEDDLARIMSAPVTIEVPPRHGNDLKRRAFGATGQESDQDDNNDSDDDIRPREKRSHLFNRRSKLQRRHREELRVDTSDRTLGREPMQ